LFEKVDVDHGPPLDVICFDFFAQLLSLVQNPSITKAENLAIDINDPLKPYFELKGSNVLGEALSGSVYCKAYNQLINDPEKQLFVRIIQWIDCTSCSLQLFLPKYSEGVSRHGGIMGFCPRGSHHQLKSRHFAWVMPSNLSQGAQWCIGVILEIFTTITWCIFANWSLGKNMRQYCHMCVVHHSRYARRGYFVWLVWFYTSGIQRSHQCCDLNYNDLKNCDVHCKCLEASDMDVIAGSEDDETTD
jgi:hypothetical protein